MPDEDFRNGLQEGRSVQNDTGCRRFNHFEADATRELISGSRLCLLPKKDSGFYRATVYAFEAVNCEFGASLMGRDNRGL